MDEPPNETVEKLVLPRVFPGPGQVERPGLALQAAVEWVFCPARGRWIARVVYRMLILAPNVWLTLATDASAVEPDVRCPGSRSTELLASGLSPASAGRSWDSAGEYQVEYEPLNVNEYQRQYEVQQSKYLKKRAAKFGFQLLPT